MEVQMLLCHHFFCGLYPRLTMPWHRATAMPLGLQHQLPMAVHVYVPMATAVPTGRSAFFFFFFEGIQEWSCFYTTNCNRYGWAAGRSPNAHGRDLLPSLLPIPWQSRAASPLGEKQLFWAREKAHRIHWGFWKDWAWTAKKTLIHALFPCKYFFKIHCSYLGCSYTTANHKWWLSSSSVDRKLS